MIIRNTILLIAVLSTSYSSAQEETKLESNEIRGKSKVEEYYSTTGILLEKQFHQIGNVKGVEVQMLQVIDLGAKTEMRALRFEMSISTQYSSDTKVAVIDKDEVEGLVRALELIQVSVIPTTRNAYTEVSYTSRSGFQVGCYFDAKKVQWKAFVQVDKYSSRSHVFMNNEDLGQLTEFIKQAHL